MQYVRPCCLLVLLLNFCQPRKRWVENPCSTQSRLIIRAEVNSMLVLICCMQHAHVSSKDHESLHRSCGREARDQF